MKQYPGLKLMSIKILQPNYWLKLESLRSKGPDSIISTIKPLCICIELLSFQRALLSILSFDHYNDPVQQKGQALLSAIDRWGNYSTEKLSDLRLGSQRSAVVSAPNPRADFINRLQTQIKKIKQIRGNKIRGKHKSGLRKAIYVFIIDEFFQLSIKVLEMYFFSLAYLIHSWDKH